MDFSSVALTNTPSNASDPFSHSPGSTFGVPSAYVGVSTSTSGSTGSNNNGINNATLPVVNSTSGDPFEDSLEEGHVFGQGRSAAAGPQGMAKLRRDSIAHSQGMGGVSWGSLTIGSWLRDEVMFHATLKSSRSNSSSKTTVHLYPPSSSSQTTTRRPSHPMNFSAGSPPAAYNAYLPNLEKQYCKDYSCCGLSLPGLHDLLRHYEEAHIATSPSSNIQISGPLGSSKKRFYRQQNSSDVTAIPRHQQQLANHQNQFQQQQHNLVEMSQQPSAGNFRKSSLQQQGLSQHQHHIIQQQLSPCSTMATSATNIRCSGSPAPLCNPGAAGSDQPQGPQLHLNGSLVDAVSTNDVFLQSGGGNNNSNSRGSSPVPRYPGSKQRHNVQQSYHRSHQDQSSLYHSHSHEQSARPNVIQQNTDIHKKSKVPLTPQHSFTAYSLQGGKNPSKRTEDSGASANNKPITQQSNDLSNISNNKIGTNKFVPNMSSGLELDFMDEDIVGSDVDEAGFMRLTSASPQPGMPFPSHSSSSASSRFASMTVLNSMNHSTPPNSGTALVGPLINATSMVVEDDVDVDEDEDEDEDEEDDDMSGGASNSQSKTLQSSFRRQDAYIDDPARRLYVMDHEEHKPFKCPVIGCDKTYKNQNGLKYHKLHGHQNQKLYENPDGTFSIIDPESNEPYPDGMGYEKDKPYRCEVCGKRYKNLNGLKYHRGHSTH